jgi:hypothetical protein
MRMEYYPGTNEGEARRKRLQARRMREIKRDQDMARSKRSCTERGPAFVTREGDNFRFVTWGRLEDLKLWQ